MEKENVIGYCRVSTSQQKESLSVQEYKIKNYCKNKGYTILKIYKDICSGLKNNYKNINLGIALDFANNNNFKIIVTHIDRITRNIVIYDKIVKLGVKIIPIHQQNDSIVKLREWVGLANKETKLLKEREQMSYDYLENELKEYPVISIVKKIYKDVYTFSFSFEIIETEDNDEIKLMTLFNDNNEKLIFLNSRENIELTNMRIIRCYNEFDILYSFFNELKKMSKLTKIILISYNVDLNFIENKIIKYNIDIIKLKKYDNILTFYFPSSAIIVLDIYYYIKNQYSHKKYELTYIAKEVLNEKRIYLTQKSITRLFNNYKDLEILTNYCLRKTQLILGLEKKFKCYNYYYKLSSLLDENLILLSLQLNYNCRFKQVLFSKLEKLYNLTNDIKRCLLFIYICLNNFINLKIRKNLLYYTLKVKETHCSSKSTYRKLIEHTNAKIGELIYYTYKNGCPTSLVDIENVKEIDVYEIYKKSIKRELNNFFQHNTIIKDKIPTYIYVEKLTSLNSAINFIYDIILTFPF
jgi:hypothetical protein